MKPALSAGPFPTPSRSDSTKSSSWTEAVPMQTRAIVESLRDPIYVPLPPLLAHALRPRFHLPFVGATGPGSPAQCGCRRSHSDVLLFLHADTRSHSMPNKPSPKHCLTSTAVGGRFNVRFDSDLPAARIVGGMMNLRSTMEWHRHRRPGHLRPSRSLRAHRRVHGYSAHGRYRFHAPPQTSRTPRPAHHIRRHCLPSLGTRTAPSAQFS